MRDIFGWAQNLQLSQKRRTNIVKCAKGKYLPAQNNLSFKAKTVVAVGDFADKIATTAWKQRHGMRKIDIDGVTPKTRPRISQAAFFYLIFLR